MLSINDINLLKSQNEGLKKQNEKLQQACKRYEQALSEIEKYCNTILKDYLKYSQGCICIMK